MHHIVAYYKRLLGSDSLCLRGMAIEYGNATDGWRYEDVDKVAITCAMIKLFSQLIMLGADCTIQDYDGNAVFDIKYDLQFLIALVEYAIGNKNYDGIYRSTELLTHLKSVYHTSFSKYHCPLCKKYYDFAQRMVYFKLGDRSQHAQF